MTDHKIVSYLLGVVSGETEGLSAGLILVLLSLLEGVYWIFSSLSRRLTAPKRLPVPVISVGNLVAGGTGKTPSVIWLVRELQMAGFNPAILTRGYGGTASEEGLVVRHADLERLAPGIIGDEPYLLAKLLPETAVGVGRDRWAMGLRVLREVPGVDCFILDDGFQYWKLERKFDLVLLEASNPFGYGHLIPRGTLREPVQGLKRAGAILITRTEQVDGERLMRIIESLNRRFPAIPCRTVRQTITRIIPLSDFGSGDPGVEAGPFLKGRLVAAITGIGNPGQFFETVEKSGAILGFSKSYPDHYGWTPADICELAGILHSKKIRDIMITAKDGVKLKEFSAIFREQGLEFYIMNLEFQVADPEILSRVVESIRAGR